MLSLLVANFHRTVVNALGMRPVGKPIFDGYQASPALKLASTTIERTGSADAMPGSGNKGLNIKGNYAL